MARRRTLVAGCIVSTFILGGILIWMALGYMMRLWLWTGSATCDPWMQYVALTFVEVDARKGDGETPLIMAARSGCTLNLLELLERGADVNARTSLGTTALYYAAAGGEAKAVEILLRAGANPNIAATMHKFTPLMRAAQRGHVQVVRQLLAAGADPTMKDWRGRTALDYAKEGSYPEHRMIERLLRQAMESPPARRQQSPPPPRLWQDDGSVGLS